MAARQQRQGRVAAVHRRGGTVFPAAKRTPAYSSRLIREMLFFEPKHQGTDIPAALTFLNHVVPRRAIVFLLTDFLHSLGPATTSTARQRLGRDTLQEIGLTNARHDLVCLHLHDPRESALPNAGLLTLEDAESGELVELDSNRSAVRDKFSKINAGAYFGRTWMAPCNEREWTHCASAQQRNSAGVLQRFFETRRARRRR